LDGAPFAHWVVTVWAATQDEVKLLPGCGVGVFFEEEGAGFDPCGGHFPGLFLDLIGCMYDDRSPWNTWSAWDTWSVSALRRRC
jgi:hypothetical protein